jgi:hypothetical protein
VTISKSWGAVEGYYLIDPSLPIPPPPLVPPETEQDRKHLKIDVNVGTINVDIGIADPGPAGPSDPLKLSARGGTTGTVNLRVVCYPHLPQSLWFTHPLSSLQHASSSKTRPPFHLYASSNCGTVEIALPQSFHGILRLTSRVGTSELSGKRIIANSRLLHDTNGTKLYFIGDVSGLDEESWRGDEVIVDVKLGTINVKYIS